MLPRASLPKWLSALALAIAVWSRASAADVPAPTVPAPSPAASQSQPAGGAELPAFKPGNWQYQRSVISAPYNSPPRQATITKCTDPSEEMRKKRAELTQKGCRFSSTVRTGNSYSASWTCPAHGNLLAITQVITVTGESGYDDSTEVRLQDQATRTRIVATRVGECPLPPAAPKHRHQAQPLAPSSPPPSAPTSGG